MSKAGIPIKLLYEAEGMKVTVEVGDENEKKNGIHVCFAAVVVYTFVLHVYLVYHLQKCLPLISPLCKSIVI